MCDSKYEGCLMGGYLKGVWVEVGHMVCGVHQACNAPCATDGGILFLHGSLRSLRTLKFASDLF